MSNPEFENFEGSFPQEKPFKVLGADFEPRENGTAAVMFVLDKDSVDSWRQLMNPLDDDGDFKRAIELLLERCRETM